MNNETGKIARKIIKDYPGIKKAMRNLSPVNAEKFARLDVLMTSSKAYLKTPSILIDIKPQLEEMNNIFNSMKRKEPILKVIPGGLYENA